MRTSRPPATAAINRFKIAPQRSCKLQCFTDEDGLKTGGTRTGPPGPMHGHIGPRASDERIDQGGPGAVSPFCSERSGGAAKDSGSLTETFWPQPVQAIINIAINRKLDR